MKFAHIQMTDDEAKRQGLEIIEKRCIINTLQRMHKEKMRKYHHSYCPMAVWKLMQERCIVMTEEDKVLVIRSILDKMLDIYKTEGSDYMSFYKVKEFNPLMAMFVRNQVGEC